MDEWQAKENKEEKFKKALFLCLCLGPILSVHKYFKATEYGMYRESKPCVETGLWALDSAV
ncbi:hypothetical protein [Pseudomonas mosselii]|uniref:hypothetical protein n=1 Tax=Pseudomonas mosselii TaxID=78327 RepID=UPI0011B6E268|nr:hypothetical protein [Pseudomonas mosselii]